MLAKRSIKPKKERIQILFVLFEFEAFSPKISMKIN